MRAALTPLAIVGLAAVLWRLGRAAWWVARRGLERHAAVEVARTRAARGDVTGMAEARHRAERAGRGTVRAAALAGTWALAAVVPALTPWSRPVYAAYGVVALGVLLWRGRRAARGGEPNPGGG